MPSEHESNEHESNEHESNEHENNSSNNSLSNVSSNVRVIVDLSGSVTFIDPSDCDVIEPSDLSSNIVNYTLNQIDKETGYTVVNQQGTDPSGSEITFTSFTTTDPSSNVQITENLKGVVEKYYDDEQDGETAIILQDIRKYAAQIQCSDFHGKGTISDYTELFNAASRIANETKQMQLDVDLEGFNEFGQAADDLSALFSSFIVKLKNVSIIEDVTFLTSVSIALQKICNLSNIFGKFKETILATSTLQVPKSVHDTTIVIRGVMDEVNCAIKYINHFVDPSLDVSGTPYDADLSTEEHNIISKAVSTIDNWNVLCEQGVSVAMANDPDMKYVTYANNQLKTKTNVLQHATNTLRSKLATFNLNC